MEGGKVGESDGLTFWLASPGDYDDVMAISDGIYEGNDYLPHCYHIWMTEPHRVVIVAKRDEKLLYPSVKMKRLVLREDPGPEKLAKYSLLARQDWQPLKLVESNLEVLRRWNLTWLADSLEQPTFLSLHTPPFPVPYKGGSFRFGIDLFGTKPELAYRALLAHMEMVRGEIRCTVLVNIYMH